MASNSTSNRGFAAMSEKKQREIAAMGGRASHGSRKKSTAKSSSSTLPSRSDQGDQRRDQ